MVGRIRYDEEGNCTRCGLPGSGFVNDGVCQCLDEDEETSHWGGDDLEAERRQMGLTALD